MGSGRRQRALKVLLGLSQWASPEGRHPVATARQRRGRRTNVVVADYLREHGWPDAEPTFGSEGGRDIKKVPGHAIEVKARRDFRPSVWLRQAKEHSASKGGVPCVIMRLDGQGEDASEYLVFRLLRDDVLNKGTVHLDQEALLTELAKDVP